MQSPLRVRMASVLSLLLVMIIFPFGRSQSSTSCTAEGAVCYADDACTSCATLLQGLVESGSIGTDITSCPAFFATICSAVDTDECDVTNIYLLDYAQCMVEEQYDCPGFTTCEDAMAMVYSEGPTAAPTASPTAAPIDQPQDDDDYSGASAGVTAFATAALLGTLAAFFVV